MHRSRSIVGIVWLCLVLASCVCPASEIDAKKSAAAVTQLQSWLKLKQAGPIEKQAFASVSLSKSHAARAQALLWSDHLARLRRERAAEMKARVVVIGKLRMPFHYTVFGGKPKGGRSLFISMHGGGGAPKRVNDGQWENQKRLYRPAEGVYLCPRAPTDTWNLWHQGHIDAFFQRLIENLVAFEDVNPDRVYAMGYSAGGDGVYQLAPRMADRWAAASMMAGHPNETSPLGLRNIGFTLHMGERDSAYNRNRVAAQWKEKLAELRKQDSRGYVHHVQIHAGRGHWMNRQDAVAVPWMAKFTRNPYPARIVWKQDDVTHAQFYWLALPKNQVKGRTLVTADLLQQTVSIESDDVSAAVVLLNDEMLNLDEPVAVQFNGKPVYTGTPRRTIATLARTLAERGDRRLMFSADVTVKKAGKE